MESRNEQEFLEIHKNILNELCINLNNCALCWNEESRKCDCRLLEVLEIVKLTKIYFIIKGGYDDNTEFINISKKYKQILKYLFAYDIIEKIIKLYMFQLED